VTPPPVRFRFPPLERRGVIAGWRSGQLVAVAIGLVLAVVAFRAAPSLAGVVAGLALIAAALALAFWPVAGRTGEEWIPVVIRRVVAVVVGAPSPGLTRAVRGHVLRPGPGGTVSLREAVVGSRRPAGALDGVRLGVLELGGTVTTAGHGPGTGTRVGFVADAPGHTASVVLAVSSHSFALLGRRGQESRVATWSRVLASVAHAGSEIHRIQCIERCTPDDGRAVRRFWEEHAVVDPDSEVGRSYGQLVDEVGVRTQRHEVFLVLTVHTGRSARVVKAAGGGVAGLGVVLSREVEGVSRALEQADLTIDGVLGPERLAEVIAVTTTADGRLPGSGEGAGGSGHDGTPATSTGTVRQPWPMAMVEEWDRVHVDDAWHATYWIAEWPRIEVAPDFLGPLLLAPVRRTFTVVMEPTDALRAARQVAHARTADRADAELRRRGGFLVTARHRREHQSADERDDELAEGHVQFRFSGYVTVSAANPEALRDVRSLVEQTAGQSHLELRLLYGEQDRAYGCSLPLGRGLS